MPENDELKSGLLGVAAERARQVLSEGWTDDHDDQHTEGELALAAMVYACPRSIRESWEVPVHFWPWDFSTYKPHDDSPEIDARIRELEKAGALLIAEIDRLGRLKARAGA